VFTDSDEYPSFADITADFVYARLMRTESKIKTGIGPKALEQWAGIGQQWREGKDPAELPHVSDKPAAEKPRDVFMYFISGAKERAPAAAMALLKQLG
jgi:uncharacterized protein YecE (DUF72 family)